MIEPTVSLGNILTLIAWAVGCALFIAMIKADNKVLKTRIDLVDARLDKLDGVLVILAENKAEHRVVELRVTQLRIDFEDFKKEIRRSLEDR